MHVSARVSRNETTVVHNSMSSPDPPWKDRPHSLHMYAEQIEKKSECRTWTSLFTMGTCSTPDPEWLLYPLQ